MLEGIEVMLGFGVSGIVFLDISEVINLLQEIYNQGEIRLRSVQTEPTSQNMKVSQFQNQSTQIQLMKLQIR
ncbi:hypothetical protein [Chengkuizengella sediminis]|uniref:hypothetical protein n=1 Tax=Chengkuizengella sediminis TaxID=1885917 RepID=UPI001389AB33|nr:hypothetical protein [Chengkuizengella sediminis]NDI35437.1 hypothetical protein [Chengkuizengella sediminis]